MSDWRQRAACGGDPDTFTPEQATPADIEAATEVCATCEVFAECDALRATQDEPYGVWAGQWWGTRPQLPDVAECQWCSAPVESSGWQAKRYCSASCRAYAHRARREVAKLLSA